MMTIEEISAHLEIHQILYRYCRGVDRGERETIKSVYHPGAIDQHGAFEGTGDQFAEFIVKIMDKYPGGIGQHHVTNILIELDGDTARVESYFFALQPAASPGVKIIPASGRYLDRFERRDGAWKIAHRQVVLDWSMPPVQNVETDFHKTFPNGKRREEDVSHAFFQNP